MRRFNTFQDFNYTILLTCAGGGLLKYNAFYLKQNQNKFIKVIGVDIKKNINSEHFDRFYKVPKPENKNFIKRINYIVKKDNISLIIPTSDEEILKFSKFKNFFQRKGVDIACENRRNVEIFTDKYKTYEFLKRSKIDKQDYYLIKNFKQLKSKLNIFREFVLKPLSGRGGRGVYIIKKHVKKNLYLNFGREITTDLQKFQKFFMKKIKYYPLILTPKLKEPVFDVDFLASKGKLEKIVMRKRLVSEEPNSGHKFCSVPGNIKNKFKKICKKLKLNGLYDSDLMRGKKNSLKIIEINPRPSGSVSVTCAAGLNLLSDLIDLKIGKKISEKKKILKSQIKLNS